MNKAILPLNGVDFVKQIIDSVRKQLTEKLSEGAEGSGGKRYLFDLTDSRLLFRR